MSNVFGEYLIISDDSSLLLGLIRLCCYSLKRILVSYTCIYSAVKKVSLQPGNQGWQPWPSLYPLLAYAHTPSQLMITQF